MAVQIAAGDGTQAGREPFGAFWTQLAWGGRSNLGNLDTAMNGLLMQLIEVNLMACGGGHDLGPTS